MQANLKRKLPTSESKLCGQPRKVITIKNVTSNAFFTSSIIEAIVTNFSTRNQPIISKVDTIIFIIEVESKIYKPSWYNKVITNPIYNH